MEQERKAMKSHKDFYRLCKPFEVSRFIVNENMTEAEFETLDDFFQAVWKLGIPRANPTIGIPVFVVKGNVQSTYYCPSVAGVMLLHVFDTADLEGVDQDVDEE